MTKIQIVSGEEIDITNYGKVSTGKIFIIHVRVNDIKGIANEMITDIMDKSWINNLDIIDRASYNVRMVPTVNKLVNNIFQKVENDVTKDFGEYLISHSAGNALNKLHSHIVIPLAELRKEQISGNPGFDFHTETLSQLISFGESKYRSRGNSYKEALEQIVSFITDNKDMKELSDLRKFVSENATLNAVNGKKSYVAAFSINGTNYDSIFDNIMNSNYIDSLLCSPEVYLIGVEIGQ
ncbi:MAG: hypothetical protein PHS49_03615 [Candidatus Gracilibacteria bacterium]|nr:hypothetical protein [Candidatus Gracilibacteria bacterium]